MMQRHTVRIVSRLRFAASFLLLSAPFVLLPALAARAQTDAMPARQMGSMSAKGMPAKGMAKSKAVRSTSLTVTVDGKPVTYTMAELGSMPQTSVTVFDDHAQKDVTYTGVAVSALLTKGGVPDDDAHHHAVLRDYIKAEGTDKYWVIYAARELYASDHKGEVIVATMADGKPLGDDGQLKLVSTEDKNPSRWVRNLNSLSLVETK